MAVNINPQFESIGQAFVQHYYSKFDVTVPGGGDAAAFGAARSQGLADLYDLTNSYLTFEGAQHTGRAAILAKFSSLPFKQIQRAFTVVDCQPTTDGGVIISVLGQLKTDEDPVQSYTHTFLLKPSAQSFYIANEIFRLVLHNN